LHLRLGRLVLIQLLLSLLAAGLLKARWLLQTASLSSSLWRCVALTVWLLQIWSGAAHHGSATTHVGSLLLALVSVEPGIDVK